MSWQEYVDDHLMCDLPNGGNLKSAAIVGLDGGVWAQSPNFPTLSNDEVDKTVAGFTDAGSATLAQGGLYLGGTKYLVIPGDPGAVIRGKKGQDGVTIKKTNSALVIGIYGEGVQPADGNIVVENLADYLIGQGI
ncbi:hypothetical protein CVIRNUC_009919 [Coccomyxa viridis]|uniref:Profilin n=1 Tax=Coccomyxa viridis TaxID=1274662 RepID=A0AAV1IKF4_9CHLO|nr:hypothetical protein CVIRNUC_009919 [Coccomyxa viridis]